MTKPDPFNDDEMPSFDSFFWSMVKKMWKTLLLLMVLWAGLIYGILYFFNKAMEHLPK